MQHESVHPEVIAGDGIAYAGDKKNSRAAFIAGAIAAEECEECGVSVIVPDEGVYTNGGVMCHGCNESLSSLPF